MTIPLCCHGCAGKTHLAERLAQQYGLLHVDTAAVLAELPLMDAQTQKVGAAPSVLLLRDFENCCPFSHCAGS
jgi:hypothetical protein